MIMKIGISAHSHTGNTLSVAERILIALWKAAIMPLSKGTVDSAGDSIGNNAGNTDSAFDNGDNSRGRSRVME